MLKMTKDDFNKIVSELSNIVEEKDVHSDNEFNSKTQEQIIKRDEEYTKLLEHFVSITVNRNNAKEKYKWIFFKIIMALLVILDISTAGIVMSILYKCDTNELISAFPVLITAITGFTSSIIAIPLSITKYLFSTNEDEYITAIISHTQEHDSSGRMLFKSLLDQDQDSA